MNNSFENGLVNGSIYYSRFVASFAKYANPRKNYGLFKEWLFHLGLNADDITRILHLTDNGKLELETDCEKFLKDRKVK